MRAYLRVSEKCCERFGTLSCIDCPLEPFIPNSLPACGAEKCEMCETRPECPCGNVRFRDELLEEMGAEVTLIR